jgi:hypothetical protein
VSRSIAAEQGIPADHFARKIVAFLKLLCAARSRRLTLGRWAAAGCEANPRGEFSEE